MWAYITDFLLVYSLSHFMFICAYIHGTPFLYTCTWYARHLALPYVLAGYIWQPWILMFRFWSLNHDGPAVADRSTAEAWIRRSSSFQLFSWLDPEAPLAAHENLSAFVMYISSCIVLLYFLVMYYSCNIVLFFVITMYLYFSVGMYITTVLSHSDSCMYW